MPLMLLYSYTHTCPACLEWEGTQAIPCKGIYNMAGIFPMPAREGFSTLSSSPCMATSSQQTVIPPAANRYIHHYALPNVAYTSPVSFPSQCAHTLYIVPKM